MKKSDLENGMVIEQRDGEKMFVLNEKLINWSGHRLLEWYNDDLKSKGIDYPHTTDIVKVFNSFPTGFSTLTNFLELELIWELKESVTLEEAMKHFYSDGIIECKIEGGSYIYDGKKSKLLESDCRPISAIEIMYGKWYIKS